MQQSSRCGEMDDDAKADSCNLVVILISSGVITRFLFLKEMGVIGPALMSPRF